MITEKRASAADYMLPDEPTAAERFEQWRQKQDAERHERILQTVLSRFVESGEILTNESSDPVAEQPAEPHERGDVQPAMPAEAQILEPRGAVQPVRDVAHLDGLAEDVRAGLAALAGSLELVNGFISGGSFDRKRLAAVRDQIDAGRAALKTIQAAIGNQRSIQAQSLGAEEFRGGSIEVEGNEMGGRHGGKIGGAAVATAAGDDGDKAERDYQRLLEKMRTGEAKSMSREHINGIIIRSGREPGMSYRRDAR